MPSLASKIGMCASNALHSLEAADHAIGLLEKLGDDEHFSERITAHLNGEDGQSKGLGLTAGERAIPDSEGWPNALNHEARRDVLATLKKAREQISKSGKTNIQIRFKSRVAKGASYRMEVTNRGDTETHTFWFEGPATD